MMDEAKKDASECENYDYMSFFYIFIVIGGLGVSLEFVQTFHDMYSKVKKAERNVRFIPWILL